MQTMWNTFIMYFFALEYFICIEIEIKLRLVEYKSQIFSSYFIITRGKVFKKEKLP